MKRESLNYIFQCAKRSNVEALFQHIEKEYTITVLQQPTAQTLLQPIIDPISKSPFYAGEVLVTTAIVQVGQCKGWAMVMDDDEKLSLMIATLDACFEAGIFQEEMHALYKKTEHKIAKEMAKTNQRIHATKVNFDLMQG